MGSLQWQFVEASWDRDRYFRVHMNPHLNYLNYLSVSCRFQTLTTQWIVYWNGGLIFLEWNFGDPHTSVTLTPCRRIRPSLLTVCTTVRLYSFTMRLISCAASAFAVYIYIQVMDYTDHVIGQWFSRRKRMWRRNDVTVDNACDSWTVSGSRLSQRQPCCRWVKKFDDVTPRGDDKRCRETFWRHVSSYWV